MRTLRNTRNRARSTLNSAKRKNSCSASTNCFPMISVLRSSFRGAKQSKTVENVGNPGYSHWDLSLARPHTHLVHVRACLASSQLTPCLPTRTELRPRHTPASPVAATPISKPPSSRARLLRLSCPALSCSPYIHTCYHLRSTSSAHRDRSHPSRSRKPSCARVFAM